jgi:hypothetical protein
MQLPLHYHVDLLVASCHDMPTTGHHLILPLLLAVPAAFAQPKPAGWEIGGVLDVSHGTRELAFGQRNKGAGLGHSDLSLRGPLGTALAAQLTAAAHSHDGKLEAEIEEAWVETRALSAGLQARVGRFSSQISRLNEQHPHADDHAERPLLHRAFFGGHWFDDGLRLNWTAPTALYLRLGAEVFNGRHLVPEAATARTPGALTLSARTGGDLGTSASWQAGAAWLHNRREAEAEDPAAPHEHEAHGAAFSGRRNLLMDLTWKWAPDGNNRQRQLRIDIEHARITGLTAAAASLLRHQATSLSAVWRFSQAWEVGARADTLKANHPQVGGTFEGVRLRELTTMVAWKPTHGQTLRLQLTRQSGAESVDDATARAIQLQYVLSFGAHGAHAY